MPSRLLRAVAAAGLLVAVGACSDGGPDTAAPTTTAPSAGPTTTRASTATTAAPVATTAGTAATPTTVPNTGGTLAGEVTIRGTVSSMFLSARVLGFDPPVDGYSRVALTTDTEYRKADGSPAMLIDVDEGSVVQVTGTPGSDEALIARLVVIVG